MDLKPFKKARRRRARTSPGSAPALRIDAPCTTERSGTTKASTTPSSPRMVRLVRLHESCAAVSASVGCSSTTPRRDLSSHQAVHWQSETRRTKSHGEDLSRVVQNLIRAPTFLHISRGSRFRAPDDEPEASEALSLDPRSTSGHFWSWCGASVLFWPWPWWSSLDLLQTCRRPPMTEDVPPASHGAKDDTISAWCDPNGPRRHTRWRDPSGRLARSARPRKSGPSRSIPAPSSP